MISFIRWMLVLVAMMAARFCRLPSRGSYSRETVSRNRKKVSTSSSPRVSSQAPARAVVAIPSRSTSPADTTKVAVPNSEIMARCSMARIFPARPWK